jgi:hypothetical protein
MFFPADFCTVISPQARDSYSTSEKALLNKAVEAESDFFFSRWSGTGTLLVAFDTF